MYLKDLYMLLENAGHNSCHFRVKMSTSVKYMFTPRYGKMYAKGLRYDYVYKNTFRQFC